MFELGDAVLSSPRVNSFAELSCSPLFRRQWSSLYEALQDSRPQRRKLMQLYIEQMSQMERPVIAGDHTIWARPYAVTLQERTYDHQATMLGNRPVGVGQGWSTLTWIPEAGSSWALPLRHERITSFESPISKAAWQLRQVCQALNVRAIPLWDSEYGCARFVLATADIACDKLIRLRSNRCLWTAPPADGGRGRPRVHGDKFKLNHPTTWHHPDQQSEVDDPKQGRLRLQCWRKMHFRTTANHSMQLILVERLAQSMAALFTQLGTPTQVPKPRGKSLGWIPGQSRTPRVRAPIVKKRYSKRKKQAQTSA
jgi:hypothetical protein